MKRTFITASLVIFLSTNLLGSQANAQANDLTIRGIRNCAQWAKDRSEDGWPATAVEYHLVGILNGMVMALRKDFWTEGGRITNDQVYFWMDRYCDNNPLQGIALGAASLFYERTSR